MLRKTIAAVLVSASGLVLALALRDQTFPSPTDRAALIAAERSTLNCAPDEYRGSRVIDYAAAVGTESELTPSQVVAEYLRRRGDTSRRRSSFRVIRRGEGYRFYAPSNEGRVVRLLVVTLHRQSGWKVTSEHSCS